MCSFRCWEVRLALSDPGVANADAGPAGRLREIAVGGLAGIVAGFLVAGVGGRFVMRLTSLVAAPEAIGRVTDSGFAVGTVTMNGTVELLLFVGIGFGMLGGLLLVILWPWVSDWGHWRPVAVAGFALALASTEVVDPSNRDFAILGNEVFAVLVFWSLFFAFGFLAVWVRGAFDRRFPIESRRSTVVYGIVAVLGLLPAFLLLETLFFNEFSDIPTVVSIAMVVLGLATLGLWIMTTRRSEGRTSRTIRIVGYVAIVVTLVFGLTKAVSDAIDIIA